MTEKIVTSIMNDDAATKRGWNVPRGVTNKSYRGILPEETSDLAMISCEVFLNAFPAGTSQAWRTGEMRGPGYPLKYRPAWLSSKERNAQFPRLRGRTDQPATASRAKAHEAARK